jgi:hypothetical protein
LRNQQEKEQKKDEERGKQAYLSTIGAQELFPFFQITQDCNGNVNLTIATATIGSPNCQLGRSDICLGFFVFDEECESTPKFVEAIDEMIGVFVDVIA